MTQPNPVVELAALFQNPPAAFRPVPQWSWNGALTKDRIREQLRQFAAQGCGGLFAHARPGHITGYMSDAYLELWRFALEEAAHLGMAFHIYDEFMCPAGHAGGLVTAERPHLATQELTLVPWTGQGRRPGGALAAVQPGVGATTQLLNLDGLDPASPEAPVLLLAIQQQPARAGFGDHPFPDLLRRETADAFLASTHERYAEACGDRFDPGADGSPGAPDGGVRFMFSDEPELVSTGGLPLSRDLLAAFYQDHGYVLDNHLLALATGGLDASPVRFDYWSTVNRLFNEAFMQPVANWCASHRLLFTGHLMEHEWPSPRSHPSAMASLRWMHAPGADLLGFQFTPTTPQDNGLYLMNLVELRSVKRQLGRQWMLVETCGGGGYDKAFDLFKPLEDLVLAYEFNVIDPHLSAESLAGMRKYDWPQTLSDHSPWWEHYRHQADHVARINTVFGLDTGKSPSPHRRVLLLHPTTTGWLHYTAPVFEPFDPESGERLAALRAHQIDLVVALLGAQLDVDLGDEFILAELGHAAEGRLQIGPSTYDAVVVPAVMENWTSSTLDLIESYLEAGGHVYTLPRGAGPAAPQRVDGRRSAAPSDLQARFTAQWHVCPSVNRLVELLREVSPPRITDPMGEPLPDGLVWRQKALDQGHWLTFLCNPWSEPLVADIRLPGRSLRALDTADGTISDPLPTVSGPEMQGAQEGQGRGQATLIARIELPPRGHVLWLTSSELSGPRPVTTPTITPARRPIALSLTGVERRSPNLVMLDYCDLEANGHRLADAHTIHADAANWRWQGFDQNPWRQAHQFKRTAIDRPIARDRRCQIGYRFNVDPALPQAAREDLRIGVERPWLYAVALNGQPLDVGGAARWFDEDARALATVGGVQPGENLLTLTADPFDVLCEIMPVYLIGDVAAVPAVPGFRVADPGTLSLGDWTQMGMPFYPGAVRYTFRFSLDGAAGPLTLTVPSWEGTIVVAYIDGAKAGTIAHPPYALKVSHPGSGSHTLALDVVGNMRNMMGPHHADGLPGSWTWDRSPRHQPPGTAYRTAPSGLLAMPLLAVS